MIGRDKGFRKCSWISGCEVFKICLYLLFSKMFFNSLVISYGLLTSIISHLNFAWIFCFVRISFVKLSIICPFEFLSHHHLNLNVWWLTNIKSFWNFHSSSSTECLLGSQNNCQSKNNLFVWVKTLFHLIFLWDILGSKNNSECLQCQAQQ